MDEIPFLDESNCTALEKTVLMLLRRVEALESQVDELGIELNIERKSRIVGDICNQNLSVPTLFMCILSWLAGVDPVRHKEYANQAALCFMHQRTPCHDEHIALCRRMIDAQADPASIYDLLTVNLDGLIGQSDEDFDGYLLRHVNIANILQGMNIDRVRAFRSFVEDIGFGV